MSRPTIIALGMVTAAIVFIACETGKPEGDAGPWYIGTWGAQSEGLSGSRQVEVTISADRRVNMMSRLPNGQVEFQRTGWVETDSQIRMDDGEVVAFRRAGGNLEILDPSTGQHRSYQKIQYLPAGSGAGAPGASYQPSNPTRATSFDRGLVGQWEGSVQGRDGEVKHSLEINGDGSVELHSRHPDDRHSRKARGYLADGGRMIVLYGESNLTVNHRHRRLDTRDVLSGQVVTYRRVRD